MALQTQSRQQKEVSDRTIQKLVAHVSRLANCSQKHSHEQHNNQGHYAAWMIQPPTNNIQMQLDKRL